MGQFGEELRRERVSRGIALATISEKTKVVTRYLTALEDEQFDRLPGGILSKGIVRGYARTLGLDESAWVERFLNASRPQGAPESDLDWIEFARNVSHSRNRRHSLKEARLRWLGVALLLFVLAGFGWFVWQYVSTRVLAASVPAHPVTSTLATDSAPASVPR